MRRGEVLALQWPAIDFSTATISVAKSVEPTKRFGLRLTTPKSKRSRRSFQVDAGTLEVLKREHDRQKRIVAGVPDGVDVNLTLVKLPPGAFVFPAVGPDLCAIRHPDGVTAQFLLWARGRGFDMSFHDIRAGHETALLDAGVPVHVVAERCGHDPAVLLRHYARRTARNDAAAAAVIGRVLGGILGTSSREPDPWDAAVVTRLLPDITNIPGIDWSTPIGTWPKDALVRFLCAAFDLIRRSASETVKATLGTTAH
jgi:integrase